MRRLCSCVTGIAAVGTMVVLLADTASAAPTPAPTAPGPIAPPPELTAVINNMSGWLRGFLAGLATLYLTIGGVRYLTANGDPTSVEKGKASFKYAGLGYAVAALAPILVTALKSVVGA